MKTTDQCTCPEVDVSTLGEPPRPVEAIVRGLAADCPVHGENAWARSESADTPQVNPGS